MTRKRKFLLASVLALQNSNFIYPSCQKCLSRIIVVSKRSNCPKCGSTGEAENTNYRYKLSLKVTESNRLFGITVFGSCLDAFFGLPATGLYRYIEDPNEIPETLDSDTAQNLLTKAVETCFLGQSFIFGVTNFRNQHLDSRKFIPDHKRQVQALVASQIVLPDPSVAGFTVLDYFHQLLQTSNAGKLHQGTQANSCVPASGHSESDLSSICGSDNSTSFLESCGRDACLQCWQPCLELPCSVSHPTDDEGFSASEQCGAIGGLHQNGRCISFAEVPGSNGDQDALQHSRSLGSCVDKKSDAEKPGDKVGLQANQGDAVYSNHHEIGVTDSDLFPMKMQELLERSNIKSPRSAVEIKNKSSQPELTAGHQHDDGDIPCGLQESAACASPPRRLEEIASVSQDWDPEVWDELPFSESLDKFLAVIESDITKTPINTSSRNYIDNGHDKLHTDDIRFSVTPQRTATALPSPLTALRSLQTTAKADSSKDSFHSRCEANPGPGVPKTSQPDHIETVRADRREISDSFLPNAYLSAIFPSSVEPETSIPKKASISPKPSASENGLSFLNLKHANGENSLAERREKLTALSSWKYDVSDLCNLEKKKYYRWPESQDDSLKICRQLIYPLEPVCSSTSSNTPKELPHGLFNNLTQSYSCNLGHSYNASADLFDVSAKEMEIASLITKRSQDSHSLWEQSLKESHHAESYFSLRSLSKSSSQSQKLAQASPNISAVASRTHSPPDFLSDSDFELEASQDFVPFSQSTPISRVHQTRIHEVKRAFERLPAFYSDIDANYKKRRISSEIDTQPGTQNGPKHENAAKLQRSQTPVRYGVTPPVCLDDGPLVAGCFEPADSDWVPPTTKKGFLSDKLRFCFEPDDNDWVPPTTKKGFLSDKLRFQSASLRKGLATCNSPYQEELTRKELKPVPQRTDTCFIKDLKSKLPIVATQKTPNYACKHSGWTSRESVICSKVRSCLPFSENRLSSVPETSNIWSPELFSQKVT
ncbi:DNA damage-induced apoptosis suppressor protein [Echinops telfairi]|uniref:DNA damage-induced apoptosis suppressor protein n=1 Tax=Echinops telfairi TaxID=9371 RepID=A0ABM0IVZ2_ECHTE|nr:DNA damage-induced apoptosis suppressor protein [Echinops telfairi]